MGFTIKLAEPWLTLIVRLRVVIRMELVLVATEMLDMVQLMEDMEKVATSQNTNVIRAMKLNATPLLVRYHLIIVRIEKKRSAKNLPKWFLFLLKSKIVMMK